MRSANEQKIVDAFLKEYNANGGNSIWASETLDYTLLKTHPLFFVHLHFSQF